ncbi:tyrosyl-DNA phosphodiesterase-like protein [Leptomonas pyrrhocoris]|uniref:Tyrosyl-DNA phosphodiesterase-like protein n=1 Tax=Leptomonas pyrrhocoris TaxID=157538 RepID=A0A0M9G862_LEPPY|nr:tyrosyl-DNA phosphodiesterase-like protein [Leptomonas pyrrhocoris]XP_015662865.1 tyrosyl-DNA phosphodiesterase-like protein [Leptomonas pyrrhocoris]KPA84425.1 tyrosyl-DNA phosphodiesterase-like protein [Leptomonas pyrrhocoris]KPA84426.1 tyrosyl-DNA phosphodiesterase-like protein [Leptomonas pyrrhocoris]|eukprot:XP_015662864.1 tyrosyl-DNA phosphodiesterase-like protein [Leptomonas pyrrhocoris]
MTTTTAAFPLWINDVAAITELQMSQHSSDEHVPRASAPSSATSLLTIRDLFRCNTHDPQECWRYTLLSSYVTDLEWLLTSVPELSAVTQKVLVLSGDKGTATLRRNEHGHYLPTSSALDRVNPFLAALQTVAQSRRQHTGGGASSSSASSLSAVRLTRDRFAALEPPLPIAFGTYHTKMAVCVNARGVRVCIFTANLVEQDWRWKTQGIYMQDFPWEGAASDSPATVPLPKRSAKASDFARQLRRYWACCGLDMSTPFSWETAEKTPLGIFNTDFLAHVNFAEAKVWLVSSVPGTHVGGEASAGYRVGLCRLAEALQSSAVAVANKDAPLVLTWQYSSQGSVNPKFLNALQAAMCGSPELVDLAAAHKDFPPSCSPPANVQDVQIIYPTEAEVRNSFEGWRGGGSLPLRLQCCHEFVNERLHRWGCQRRLSTSSSSTPSAAAAGVAAHYSRASAVDVDALDDDEEGEREGAVLQSPSSSAFAYRQYALPHIKSYAAVHADRTHLHWYLLTSANLSQAAWGSIGAKATNKTPRRLLVRSYELGVLYDRTSAVSPSATPCFSVVASPCIRFPTFANSADALFSTPLSDSSRSRANVGTENFAEPSLFLPCNMLRPEPYASSATLRADRRSNPEGVALPLSCRDVPWVIEIPHRGPDAYGRDVEEAFAADTLPPLSRWRPCVEEGEAEKPRVTARKRARD